MAAPPCPANHRPNRQPLANSPTLATADKTLIPNRQIFSMISRQLSCRSCPIPNATPRNRHQSRWSNTDQERSNNSIDDTAGTTTALTTYTTAPIHSTPANPTQLRSYRLTMTCTIMPKTNVHCHQNPRPVLPPLIKLSSQTDKYSQ